MSTSIARFLGTATGPARLRGELARASAPVRALPDALAPLGALGTTVPGTVLGEELVALLSDRLARALQEENETAVAVEVPALVRSQTGTRGHIPPGQDPTPFGPPAVLPRATRLGGGVERRSSRGAREWPSVPSPPATARTEGQGIALEPREPMPFEPNTRSQAREGIAGPASQVSIPQRGRRGPPSQSLLERKLEQYWELRQPSSPAAERAAPAQVEREVGGRASAALAPLSGVRAAPAWPEQVGQQAALKAQQLLAHSGQNGSSRRVVGQLSPDPSEKIEIQNVFNIEVQGGDGTTSTADLADTLADILREQAMQHGIDVT